MLCFQPCRRDFLHVAPQYKCIFHDVTGAMRDTLAVSPSSELHNMLARHTGSDDRDDCSEHDGFGRS